MRLASAFALSALALVLAPLGCSTESAEDESATTGDEGTSEDELKGLTLTEADDGKTVSLPKGSSLVLRLQSNPSTGFRWKVVETDRSFGYPASTRFLANGDGVGSGGVERMTWKTNGATPLVGAHKVKLEYKRPWETDASPAKTFAFTVKITETSCPELSPPAPGFCKDGRIQPKKDASGCTTGFECMPDCRANGCGDGKKCVFCWSGYACIPGRAMC